MKLKNGYTFRGHFQKKKKKKKREREREKKSEKESLSEDTQNFSYYNDNIMTFNT